MWKKEESETANPSNLSGPETPSSPPPGQGRTGSSERAAIGRSITIHGEVTGDEDLLIQGRVDGSVELKQQAVTVGQEGRVTAAITSRIIVVEGEVEGDLQAGEQVVLRSTARVRGDITSPRVVLEDGATFTGGVDMGDPLTSKSGAGGSVAPTQKTSAGSGSASSSSTSPAGKTEKDEDSGKADD
jgi:cytoskeletal protein CcmA (bactofilin family)